MPAPPNYQIEFTALIEGLSDIAYPGTCPEEPTHVAGVGYTPWAYYVFLNSGQVDVLPTNKYVEGPYSGAPRLSKTANDALPRVLNAFAREFRGAAQQEDYQAQRRPASWNKAAFDFRTFMTSQYLLAPARGTIMGESVMPLYPAAVVAAPGTAPYVRSAGTLATFQGGGTAWPVHSQCVISGWYARAVDLAGGARLNLIEDGQPVSGAGITLSSSSAEGMQWLSQPVAAGAQIGFELADRVQFTSAAGRIEIEAAELYDYKPDISDLMLVLRVSSARRT
jgi:hypothetical protein